MSNTNTATKITALPCVRCQGEGTYRWGGTINGRARFSGVCFRCAGSGRDPGHVRGQEEFAFRFDVHPDSRY